MPRMNRHQAQTRINHILNRMYARKHEVDGNEGLTIVEVATIMGQALDMIEDELVDLHEDLLRPDYQDVRL